MERIFWMMVVSVALLGSALGVVPEHKVENGSVRLAGVSTQNPVIYDNDWWFDVFDNDYLWAQASLGEVNLRGNIISRDMWEWRKGYQYKMEDSVKDARKALTLARNSGLKNIPELTLGSDRALERPPSGKIEDTKGYPSDGSRLIVEEAKKASPEKPLLVIAGGPLTTVANALLSNPEIGPNMVVFNLTVNGGYNGKDGWSVFIVTKKTRYVDWGGGSFWERDSVFGEEHFVVLPENEFTADMKRFIKSDLGRANQLGDGAPLVWLWEPRCWRDAVVKKASFNGDSVELAPVNKGEAGDVLVIPKRATDLELCRREFFRVLTNPSLFKAR